MIFADLALTRFQAIMESLNNGGILAEGVVAPHLLLEKVKEKNYEVCVVSLLLGTSGSFDLISQLRSVSKNKNLRIIVFSRQIQRSNIENSIKAGANDFIAEPFEVEGLFQRILYHLGSVTMIDSEGYEDKEVSSNTSTAYLNLLLECSEILSHSPKGHGHAAFMQILMKVATLLDSNRASLMLIEKESNTGIVLASSDDPAFRDFPISLIKYPEILHVLHTGNFVLVEDVSKNILTANIQKQVKSIQIGSLMVFPVRYHNEVIGVLTIKRRQQKKPPGLDEIRIIQAIANTTAAHSNIRAILRRAYREFGKPQPVA